MRHGTRLAPVRPLALVVAAATLLACIAPRATASVAVPPLSKPVPAPTPATTPAAPKATTTPAEALGSVPLSFEPNVGQADARAKYLARGAGYTVFLTGTEAVLALAPSELDATVLRFSCVDAKATARLVAERPLAGRVNYLRGDDPSKYRTDVPTYGAVRYEGVYDGVDLVYYGRPGALEYDVVVAPGADVSHVRMKVDGADTTRVEDGDLILSVRGRELRQTAPSVYQAGPDGGRERVAGRYVDEGGGVVGFRVGAHDAERPLVIDPAIVYSTFLGGRTWTLPAQTQGTAIAVDATGSYVTGTTAALDFPGVGAGSAQDRYHGSVDAFVTKVNPAGSAILYATYLGGSDMEQSTGIAVENGEAYVVGNTRSATFPTAGTPAQSAFAGISDGFVAKLSADGSTLVYSTFLGGVLYDTANAVAVENGVAYVVGQTLSADFPVASPLQSAIAGNYDAFVTKVGPTGSAFTYSTFLGGIGSDGANGVAVVGGEIYVTGDTSSFNFPTVAPAIQPTGGGNQQDAFLTKIAASGASLVYSTYLGGSSLDTALDVAVDAGEAYVVGATVSSNFPTAGSPFQSVNHGGSDAFVTKVNAAGTALVYSTFLGGGFGETAAGVSVASGSAIVAGTTTSADFPTAGTPFQSAFGGSFDLFVTKLAPSGSSLVYSTYLGGANSEDIGGVAVLAGEAYVTGSTASVNFPTTGGSALQPTLVGGQDAFVTRLAASGSSLVASTYLGAADAAAVNVATSLAVDATGALYVAGGTVAVDFPVAGTPVQGEGDGLYGDAFVTKLTPAGDAIVYSTYLGGSFGEVATGVAAEDGEIYLAGFTQSSDFPVAGTPFQSTFGGITDGFVAKIGASGSALVYSTYLGGSGFDTLASLAVDGGKAFVTGNTPSTNFPTANAIDTTLGGSRDAFVACVGPTGSAVYSTYLGGAGEEQGFDLAVENGEAYAVGLTQSADFPVAGTPFQSALAGTTDAYLTKFSATGTSLVYSTYFGGTGTDNAYGVAVENGAAYVVGQTSSTNLPTAGTPAQPAYSGSNDGFVAEFAANGSSLAYSTYLGGHGNDQSAGVTVSNGEAYVVGSTQSSDFPTAGTQAQPGYAGDYDAFVTRLNATGSAFVSSTYLGGGEDDSAGAVAVVDGEIFVAGATKSLDFPTTADALEPDFIPDQAVFLVKLGELADLSVSMTDSPDPVATGGTLTYTITVSNAGPSPATNVVVTDTLPSQVTFASATSPGATQSGTGNARTFTYATLAAGASATITIAATVDCSLAGGATISNGASVASDTADPDPSDDATGPVVTTVSNPAPVLGACPQNVTVNESAPGSGSATATYTQPTATDNCSAVVSCLPASGATFPAGVTTVTCTATDSAGATSACSFTVSVNRYPVANAGQDRGETSCTTVVLSAAGSTDPDAFPSPLTYAWAQTAGPTVQLFDATTATPRFEAPNVALSELLTFQVTVSDGLASAADAVTITVDRVPDANVDTIGLRATNGDAYFLRNCNSPGAADVVGALGVAGEVPLAGDWNGDGTVTAGVYDVTTGCFYLRDAASGPAETIVCFGVPGAVPIVGDWDGNGTTTIGIYDRATATFFLKNTNAPGVADATFVFGGANQVPLSGDWDGDGVTTIGIYVAATGTFFLRNANTAGGADVAFTFGPVGAGVVPLVGNWDGIGGDTVGVYIRATSVFFLKNANANGGADIAFQFGAAGGAFEPFAGNWDGF